MPITDKHQELIIAGVTPYFLERGVLWFQEHEAEIRKKAFADHWWREHSAFVMPGAKLPYSPFLRKLADMGYTKSGQAQYRGEFAARGGIVDVFPINMAHPVRIEFIGNAVERILTLPLPGEERAIRRERPKDPSEYERLWLAGLRPGDYLVHVDHGIGVFRGFENSYYALEYAPPRKGGMPDRLLVPRTQAPKLSRYIGFETPAIHRLGGTVWESTKRKAREDARKFAEELALLYRTRAAASRPPYPRHDDIERHLAHSFPYEETNDQKRAIAAIHQNLSGERPMDRLLLGDVGFGKTEVALRAAARIAYAGKQVALLAPTTILADQHFATFRERLKGLPIEVVMLTRLTARREERRIVHDISAGKIDIVIGTHRLLSRDISWRELGLVIIDEEQRFGVRQKEHFKKLRAEIDVLSLSATPIPRTLSLALAKLRDISLIQEPPPGRLPTKTFVLPYSERIVGEAIRAECERQGQIFYLWNRIESIDTVRRDILRLAPGSAIAVLHGRMKERELVRVMHEFSSGRIQILIATTIIENGLDLPEANTLIVANAGRLGLSQAYQIRGRIGRGDKPAYAYFLYPAKSLTEKGRLRLTALKEAEELGAGFQIALKDLEIRGAGNVLGRQQSGTMNKVGLNLYAQLLGEALEELA
ncbi:MAG: DEAD/DEAH box helicase [Candidatus Sungbacteria bacterium]|uniref:DEAD/DEAH box helicase n=1 Tax=Candidatus Sungiibacteriota bacterium TaxID=2750080 RepID=A0A933DSX0_9BACT|nr:DEAD/DEAH box helicase [Candidatus Sungbacteria bacterium]